MTQRTPRPTPRGAGRPRRARRLSILVTALVVTACASDDSRDTGDVTTTVPPDQLAVVAGEPFPEARCEANRSAGTVTFLTGFDFAAAASIVEVITADALGFYEDLCLDVEILSSFSTANYPLVAGGQGQFASGGSFSEVVSFALTGEADLVAVYVAGRTTIDTLMIKPGVADEPADLAGTTIAVKGKLPASIEVMLRHAGLDDGTDYATVPVEGFDPVAHFAIPSIVGVPGWKSNEPGRLEREGVEFVTFDPSDGGVPGSFGAIFTTRAFLDEHPTAAEDFVRATLRGLDAAIDDPALAADAAVDLIEAGGNPNFLSLEGEVFRWAVEAELIAAATTDGTPPGTPASDLLRDEVAAYTEVDFFGGHAVDDVTDFLDEALTARITDGGAVIWPAD